MYTQCPECDVAFRVTADVLKQAAGKVRCGGCGIAFNALAHLSEELPGAALSKDTSTDDIAVEFDEPAELEAGTPPKTISAEQSVALLKTLDQLAGDDVRIEDTGVEWRVMDENKDDDEFADDPVPSSGHDEMRFDDNTPLPDDFDLDTPSTLPPPVSIAPEPEPEPQLDASQVDLAFGEPDEWEGLLDDLDEAVVAAESAIEDGAEPPDMEAQFALQAEELGLDISGTHEIAEEAEEEVEEAEEEAVEEVEEAEVEAEEELADVEPDKKETSIEEDLIAAAFEVEAAAKEAQEINLEDASPDELTRAGILDEDNYLEAISEEDEAEVLDEMKFEDSDEDRVLAEELLEDEEVLEDEFLEDEDEIVEDASADIELPDEEELAADLEKAMEGLTEEEPVEEEPVEEEPVEEEPVEEEPVEEEPVEFAEPINVDVPEPTEEEKTLNMMIDQDLLAIAEEDDDGFTSTIVQKQVSSSDEIPSESKKVAEEESEEAASTPDVAPSPDDNPLMETIIMEGESVHNEGEAARLEAGRIAAAESLKKSGFEPEKKTFRDWQPPRHSMAAAAALLFIVLLVQVIHHSREALAVSPAFQSTIGPVYRMVGSPITPAWDIKGWRFEATKGNTDEDGNVLVIYSRVGNNSDQSLPYPLVHVSLTDRFEEIIGSRILEPSEYLVDGADPSRAVKPRDTFDAVISINAPSAAATSFKLNVCYRLDGGQLRCADKDFR